MRLHPAWSPPEPEWVTLAPGVRWLLQRPDGAISQMVAAEVAAVVSRVYGGRAGLEEMGLDPETELGGSMQLERISGYAQVLAACLHARRALRDWDGMEDPASGETLDFADGDAVRCALVHGAPPAGEPLLTPFMAWLEGPRRPMAAEAMRLNRLARDHWGGGGDRCRACVEMGEGCAKGESSDGEICPRLEHQPRTPEGVRAWSIATTASGLWTRAGMTGAVSGLNYRDALLAFEAEGATDREPLDLGAAFAAFRAIESGRAEAEAEANQARETGGD